MNIILIGFMGTGKTAVGRALAAKLDYTFLDTDELIEEQTGRSISTIFADEGETGFRRMETALATSLADKDRQVIATGGGFILNPANLEPLRKNALIIRLAAPAELIYERVRYETHRPLLAGADPLGRIQALLQEREPLYGQADVTVDTSFAAPDELAEEIIKIIRIRGR